MHYRIIKVYSYADNDFDPKKPKLSKAVIKLEDITAISMLNKQNYAEVILTSGKGFRVPFKEGEKLFQKLVMMTED